MRHEVAIDNIILTCDVHAYVKKSPDVWADNDYDYHGYEYCDFDVDSVIELDSDDTPYDLSSEEIDKLMADEWFVMLVEKELIMALQAEAEKENEE